MLTDKIESDLREAFARSAAAIAVPEDVAERLRAHDYHPRGSRRGLVTAWTSHRSAGTSSAANEARPTRTGRRRLVAALVAVIALVSVLGTTLFGPRRAPLGVQVGASSAAAAVLNKSAAIVVGEPSSGQGAVGPGEYFFTETAGVGVHSSSTEGVATGGRVIPPFSVLIPVSIYEWAATNGSGRVKTVVGAPSFVTAKDRAIWLREGKPNQHLGWASEDRRYAKGLLGQLDLGVLPAQPRALQRVIEVHLDEPSGSWGTFSGVIGLLQTDISSPVRAALFRLAASLPGIRLLGTETDGIGRRGMAVAMTHDGLEQVMVFDPRNAELLEFKTVVTNPTLAAGDLSGASVPVGTSIGASTIVASGVVQSINSIPTK